MNYCAGCGDELPEDNTSGFCSCCSCIECGCALFSEEERMKNICLTCEEEEDGKV